MKELALHPLHQEAEGSLANSRKQHLRIRLLLNNSAPIMVETKLSRLKLKNGNISEDYCEFKHFGFYCQTNVLPYCQAFQTSSS